MEQRRRAVDLYFSEGMTPGRVIAELGYPSEAPANLVNRDFHAERPNALWLTDVTRFSMDGYNAGSAP